jgi:hypothetical protein
MIKRKFVCSEHVGVNLSWKYTKKAKRMKRGFPRLRLDALAAQVHQ